MSLPERCPFPTVDVIVELHDHPDHSDARPAIVLIERRFPPNGWALPGGFVDVGEPLSTAALRELKEETDLDGELLEQLFTYSDPARDDRRHTISTVFVALAHGAPRSGDDAGKVGVFHEDTLPQLAFDHGQILADYFTWRRTGRRPPPTR